MENLPVEVITHIMRYLPSIKDRQVCSLVCKSWYEAYQDPLIRYSEALHISEEYTFTQLLQLDNLNRKFFNIVVNGIEISENSLKFWERFGPSIKTLSIVNCDIGEKVFIKILDICTHLESLSLQYCRELFMLGHLLKDNHVRVQLKENFMSMKTLNLSNNRYISDAIFTRFVSIFPNIDNLILSGSQIAFFSGLYKRFYPDKQVNPSENIFTFPTILNYMKINSNKLKRLSFSNTLIDNKAVSHLSQIEDLKLETLNLRGCSQLSQEAITSLCNYQKSLSELDVGACPRITDQSLKTICSNLNNLTLLSLQSCRALTDLGISELYKLEKLQYLNISECDLIKGDGILKGICHKTNSNFKELHLSHLGNVPENVIIALSKALPNLKIFDLGFCYNAVTNKSVQAIIENNSFLETLILTMCENLSDSGLTGIRLDVNESNESKSQSLKIPLGSKAEQEVVKEAKSKLHVQKIIENSPNSTGLSLKKLQKLQNLNLSQCKGISDVSLIYAIELKELRHLNLGHCNKITEKGLQFLSVNNKSLESINLEMCQNVNDEGVLHVVKNLKRLHTLILGSGKITDLTAESIKKYGTELTHLDITYCKNISAGAISGIRKELPYLKNFSFSQCVVPLDDCLDYY